MVSRGGPCWSVFRSIRGVFRSRKQCLRSPWETERAHAIHSISHCSSQNSMRQLELYLLNHQCNWAGRLLRRLSGREVIMTRGLCFSALCFVFSCLFSWPLARSVRTRILPPTPSHRYLVPGGDSLASGRGRSVDRRRSTLAAGGWHTRALMADSTVACWERTIQAKQLFPPTFFVPSAPGLRTVAVSKRTGRFRAVAPTRLPKRPPLRDVHYRARRRPLKSRP